MNHLLIFLCQEYNMENSDGAKVARGMLEFGAEFVEPAKVEHHLRLGHMIGQSCFLIRGHMTSCVGMAQLAGYISEHNDEMDAVISLRRATAHGA